MKKILLNVALTSLASAAFAGVVIEPFNWSNVAVGPIPIAATVVPGFNPALGTLTSVAISLTGTSISGTALIENLEAYATDVSVSLIGSHTTTINGVNIVNGPFNSVSPVSSIGPGLNAVIGPVSGALSGNAAGVVPDAWAPGPHTIFVSFAGAFGVTTDPQARTTSDPDLRSTGVGSITYTYDVPEAETYVAGVALVGLVGFGFYRRRRTE